MEKYFLTYDGVKKEVSKKDWIKAEREAGFRPKLSSDHPLYMESCATGGFSCGYICGSIEYKK